LRTNAIPTAKPAIAPSRPPRFCVAATAMTTNAITLHPARRRALRVPGRSHRHPSTSTAAIAPFPGLCDSTDTLENGTFGATSARGVSSNPIGSHSSNHGMSRFSWMISRSRSSGAPASAAATKNAKRQ
jgi:hypothetical protein